MNQLIGWGSLRASQSQRGETSARLVSTIWGRAAVSRSGRADVPANLFLEDLVRRGALLVAPDLPLGRVPLGDREPLRCAELLGDRPHPVDEPLEARSGRYRFAAREVDELAREAVADRPPQVLLDQPVRQVGQRLALVERAGDPRSQRIAERRGGARLA